MEDRTEAIFDRLADIQGGIAVLVERVSALTEKVAIQNGRVTKAEYRLSELETKARISEKSDAEHDERSDAISTRSWALITGSLLVGLGAVLGHFL